MDAYMDFARMLYFDSEGMIIIQTFWSIFLITVIRQLFTIIFSTVPVVFSGDKTISQLRLKGYENASMGVSIILASHNTDREVIQTVLSLREQTIEKMQIILINDGSSDFTDAFARNLVRHNLVDQYINIQIRGGKAAALNAGLVYAKYPFTMFCDTGTTFHRDAIEIAAGYFDDPKVAAVSCGIGVRNGEENLLTYLQKLHYFMSCTISRHALNFVGLHFVISGAFGLFRTDVINKVGGHHPGTGEDLDLTLRLRHLGWKIEFSYYSMALTDVPVTIAGLLKQTLRWDRDGIKLVYQRFAPYSVNPFLKSFNPRLALGYIDNFVVGAFLPAIMYLYMAYFTFIHQEGFLFFLFTVYFVSLFVELLGLVFGLMFVNKFDRDYRYFYYAPLYILLKQLFYEPLRFISIWSELIFRHSYRDNFSPQKVQNILKKEV